MKTVVRIIEKELGWGERTCRVDRFKTEKEAKEYCDKWNEDERKNPALGGSIFYARLEEETDGM